MDDELTLKAAEDARLLDAARDMLDALKRASVALAFGAEAFPAMRDDYDAAVAAIAKAEGKQ